MEGEEGCREVGTDEEQNSTIEKELAGAIAAGKAPQFEVARCRLVNDYVREGETARTKLELYFILLADGRLVEIVDEQILEDCVKNGHAFDGRLGSVDLLERVFRTALKNRWPEIEQYLANVEVKSYWVFAADYNQSHHVQVTFRVSCNGGQTVHAVKCEGTDTIRETHGALTTIFHWVAWRLLRRLRGEQRKNGNSC